jgi:uncharacterized protein with PQ loop repeat
MPWIPLLGYLAAVVQVVRGVPQLKRVLHDHRGVSVATWSLALTSGETWFFYGVKEHLYPTILSNEGFFLLSGLVIAWARTSHRWRTILYVVPPLVLLWVPVYVLGAVAVAITTIMIVPQAVDARKGSLDGVSIATWVMALGGTILWAVYGAAVRSWEIVAPSVLIGPLSCYIIAKVSLDRRLTRELLSRSPENNQAG